MHTTHLVKLELLKTLTKLNFISIESPRIINAGLESGGSEVCWIKYFDKSYIYLNSLQMCIQIMVNVFDQVYEFSTIFRAERSDSPRHLAQISALDVEMVSTNIDDILNLLELLISNVCRRMIFL